MGEESLRGWRGGITVKFIIPYNAISLQAVQAVQAFVHDDHVISGKEEDHTNIDITTGDVAGDEEPSNYAVETSEVTDNIEELRADEVRQQNQFTSIEEEEDSQEELE